MVTMPPKATWHSLTGSVGAKVFIQAYPSRNSQGVPYRIVFGGQFIDFFFKLKFCWFICILHYVGAIFHLPLICVPRLWGIISPGTQFLHAKL